MGADAKAYIVAEIDVNDATGFDAYRAAVAPMIAEAGGRYIVRGGAVTALEGAAPEARIVILEFPDRTAAVTFWNSDAYQPVAAIRHRTANSRIYMVEGYNP